MENGAKSSDVYCSLYEEAYGKIITREVADCWVKSMDITDETDRPNGMKWSYDTAVEVGNKIGINWKEIDKVEWYCVLNMMYSDYYCVAKSFDLQDDYMYYAKSAKAWFYDNDVADVNAKTYNYYFHVLN